MHTFWKKGYEMTSVQDLLLSMGIGRASLYSTFGSKHEIFCEALSHYMSTMEHRVLGALAQEGSVRDVLWNFFSGLVDGGCADDYQGCLVTKSAILSSTCDEEIAARVAGFMDRLERAFADLLLRGRAQGEIAKDKNLPALARFFANSLQGLTVTACVRRERDSLMDVVQITLSTLD